MAAVLKVLVAGVGNIFLGDDGFGSAVAERLADEAGRPGWAPAEVQVQVRDYGVRGLHLVYDLLDGVDALVLIDVLPAAPERGGSAGEVRVLRIRAEDLDTQAGTVSPPVDPDFDPHGMDPLAVLRRLRTLGGTLPETYLVGCIAGRTEEGMGLSGEAAQAVPAAVEAVRALVTSHIPRRRQERAEEARTASAVPVSVSDQAG
jgi:hydrogenase maturation protease